jgi:hypothetical protein
MKRLASQLVDAMLNILFVGGLLFFFGCVYTAYQNSRKEYHPTKAQRAYAEHFCVDQEHGSLSRVYVTTPDLFHTNGSSPQLTIRCSFGRYEFMLRTRDLASVGAPP